MAARASDRRHTRTVETAIETRLTLDDAAALDAREDVARERAAGSARTLLMALREEREIDQLEDAKRSRAIELVTELCGLLDGTDSEPPILEQALALRAQPAARP